MRKVVQGRALIDIAESLRVLRFGYCTRRRALSATTTQQDWDASTIDHRIHRSSLSVTTLLSHPAGLQKGCLPDKLNNIRGDLSGAA